MVRNWAHARVGEIRALRTRLSLLMVDESGMSTVEYAIGTIAAARSAPSYTPS